MMEYMDDDEFLDLDDNFPDYRVDLTIIAIFFILLLIQCTVIIFWNNQLIVGMGCNPHTRINEECGCNIEKCTTKRQSAGMDCLSDKVKDVV